MRPNMNSPGGSRSITPTFASSAIRINRFTSGAGPTSGTFSISSAISRTLESAFLKQGVPYQIVRGLAFYERKENRDILAYLRLLVNPRDNLSFERAVNEPARGIGDVSLRHLKLYAEPRAISLLAACG